MDKNQQVSQVVSVGGGYLPEILGRAVIVRAGFTTVSYPQDYFVVFRGTVTNVVVMSGKIAITVSDGNQRRRQAVFAAQKTKLTAPMTDTAPPGTYEAVAVVDSSGFPVPAAGPSGGYDPDVTLYVGIDDEWLEYDNTGFSPTQFLGARGSRGSTVAVHDIDAEVRNGIQIEGNAVDVALKIMLSGWGGNWINDLVPQALGTKIDPSTPSPRAIVLPAKKDAVVDLSLIHI